MWAAHPRTKHFSINVRHKLKDPMRIWMIGAVYNLIRICKLVLAKPHDTWCFSPLETW